MRVPLARCIDSLVLTFSLLCPLESVAAQSNDLQRLLDTLREEAGAPGAILGIYTEPGQQQVLASGYADRETQRLMSPEAPYYLGSISKTYTAVTVLRLAEEGRLSLDDPSTDSSLPSRRDPRSTLGICSRRRAASRTSTSISTTGPTGRR